MHWIAQICTYIFQIFLGNTPDHSNYGGATLPRSFPLGAHPLSHFFRAFMAADFSATISIINALD